MIVCDVCKDPIGTISAAVKITTVVSLFGAPIISLPKELTICTSCKTTLVGFIDFMKETNNGDNTTKNQV